MPDNVDEQQLDEVLAILENPIRRKILKKLAQETNYPLQLSKELNVSQQAVMKHLRVLEESDFVVSFEEKSDKGGPPRKKYVPRKRYCVRIDIGPNTYDEDFYTYTQYQVNVPEDEKFPQNPLETKVEIDGKVTGEMVSDIAGVLPAFSDPFLEGYRLNLERTVREENGRMKLKMLKDLISELNSEIQSLENKRKRLLTLKERTYEEANDLISCITKDPIERDLLSLIIKEDVLDVLRLSEILDERVTKIESRLEGIRKYYF